MTTANRNTPKLKSRGKRQLASIHKKEASLFSTQLHLSHQNRLKHSQSQNNNLRGNVENFIGYTQVPLGLAGPMLINGDHANGAFSIPLATTEGALVASYSRGMKATRLSGGINTVCLEDQLERAPYFEFCDARVARDFGAWVDKQQNTFQDVISETSNYCQFKSLDRIQEGRGLILRLTYTTGDAAGQNMITLATDAICTYILEHCPIRPTHWYIESNHSGDKKAQSRALTQTRGKKIIAETIIKRTVVAKILKSSPEAMGHYFLNATLANMQAGAIGNVGHIANALTAIFIACGQDVACVAESSPGILRMETTLEGDLYAALTLPSLVVGTVGGGTHLKTQCEALGLIDCYGAGKAKKFAELCCATALAGELSIAAAIAENHFTRAHKTLGRR